MDDEDASLAADLAFLVGFLNAVDSSADDLAMSVWLVASFPSLSVARMSRENLLAARTLRDALRALALGNAGEPVDEAAVAAGSRVLSSLPIELRLVSRGSVLTIGGRGLERALGEIASAYIRALERGHWHGVKLCASPDCRFAYLDTSRNRSRRWCAMGVCGSRAKMRTYRRRQADRSL